MMAKPRREWRRRWLAWAVEHEDAMWAGNFDQVPDPPVEAA